MGSMYYWNLVNIILFEKILKKNINFFILYFRRKKLIWKVCWLIYVIIMYIRMIIEYFKCVSMFMIKVKFDDDVIVLL